MLRKRLFLAVIGLATTAAALAAEAPQATPLERVVPASAVAFVQAENLPALGAAYERSSLGEAVRGSRLLSYFQAVAGAAWDFATAVVTGLPADEARQLFGRHVGLVLLDFQRPAELVGGQPPVVLLIEAADGKKLESLLKGQLELFTLLSNQPLLTEAPHAGTTLYQVSPPKGRSFAFAFQENVLLVGSRESVTKLLDAQKADQPRLATEPTYEAVRRQLATPSGGLRVYLNARAVMEKAGVVARPGVQRILRAIGVADLKGLGVAMDFAGPQVRDRIYLHTAGPSTGVLRFLTEGQPISPAAARFVPPGYTVVASLALKDTGLWDRLYRAIADAQGEAAAGNMLVGANMAREGFGIQIKEGFFDLLTDELFVALDLSKLGSFAGAGRPPAPQEIPFVAGARLQNAPALLETLNRLAANEKFFEQGIERKARKHRDIEVATFTIPANPEVQPTYAIVDSFLLFSIRPDAVTQAIDACKTNQNLAATLLAKPAPPEALPANGHSRLDVNDAQLLATLLDLVRTEVPADVRRFLPEVDRIVKGLTGYHAVLRREPEGYSLTALSDLGTLGTVVVGGLCLDQLNSVIARRVEGDFAKLATALEEYRAKHGAYPESLEQLAPDFLPEVGHDRFQPERPYGYSRGVPDADGKFPDAWVITSVGPDKKPDIPVEQFDPKTWSQYLQSEEPEQIQRLKAVIYQFRKDQFPDERKNDDEGDLFRLGGKGLGQPAKPPPPAPAPPKGTEPPPAKAPAKAPGPAAP